MKALLAKLYAHLLPKLKHASYQDAERWYLVDQSIGIKQWQIYCLFWTWTAGRFTGYAHFRQNRLLCKRNPTAFVRRLNQFRSVAGMPLIR